MNATLSKELLSCPLQNSASRLLVLAASNKPKRSRNYAHCQKHVIDGIKLDIATIKSSITSHIADLIRVICSLEVTQKHITKKDALLLACSAVRSFTDTPWIDSAALSKKLADLFAMSDNDDDHITQDFNVMYLGKAAGTDIRSTIASPFIDPISLHQEQLTFNKMSTDLEQVVLAMTYENEATKVESLLEDATRGDKYDGIIRRLVVDKKTIKMFTQHIDTLNAQLKDVRGRPAPKKKTGRKPDNTVQNRDAPANDSGKGITDNRKKPAKKNLKS